MNPVRRQFFASLSLISLVATVGLPYAHAVGLGEIRVHSYLNDPLAATVNLTLSPSEEVGSRCIRITQPSGGAGRAGDVPYLQSAELKLVKSGGAAQLEITTRKAVVEPILSIFLQVDCPGTGRFLREYTVLLDPPLPKSLQPAYARPSVKPAPRLAPPTPRRTAPPDVWRVRRGETLSRIVAKLLPGDRRGQYRMIQEIVARNPDVFPDGDPDRLPAGARLRIPDLSVQVASKTVSQKPDAGVAHNRPTAAPQGPVEEPAPQKHRLTLTTKEQTATPETAAETARMVADTRALILETEEQYANAEALKSRLQRLEKQILLLEKALTSLDRIGDLSARREPEERVTEPKASEASVVPATESPKVAMVVPEPVKRSPPPVQIETPTPVGSSTTGEVNRVSYWWWLLAFIAIGALVLGLRARRGDEEAVASDGVKELALDELVPEPRGTGAATAEPVAEGRPDLSHKAVVFSDDPLAGLPEETEPEKGVVSNPSMEVPVLDHELTQQMEQDLMLEDFDFQERETDSNREASNILVRAEFHILLKQMESAIRLLKESIEQNELMRQEPALWLMLLRVYRQERKQEPFEVLRQRFNQLFNIEVPGWEAEEERVEGDVSTLERDFPRLMNRIVALWNTPNCALFLDSLLLDDREGTRRGFDIHVAEELLLLKGILQVRRSLQL